jgi:hypothetical protein
MRTRYKLVLAGAAALLLFACPGRRDGSIEGTIVPPAAEVRVMAVQDGTTVSAADTDPANGSFRLSLPAGTYDVQVIIPSSPFPLTFPGVIVRAGETTTMPPIELSPAVGAGSIAGSVRPAGGATRVSLLYEGKERAAVSPDSTGRYSFPGLAPGRYSLQVSAPGYAQDRIELALDGSQSVDHSVQLFYVTAIEGVDWSAGTVRATGLGRFPRTAPNRTVAREMAKRAALADAQRKLLARINEIRIGPDRRLSDAAEKKIWTVRIQGFVQGYRVAAERDRDDGVELDLELPLSGAGGLSSVAGELPR